MGRSVDRSSSSVSDTIVAANAVAEEILATWKVDPVKFVLECFGPGYEAANGKKLVIDRWQRKLLRKFIRHKPHGSCDGSPHRRIAAKACKGPGKTAVLAWIGWYRLLFAGKVHRGACVSITGDNLHGGLWAELALWQSYSPLLVAKFEHNAKAITSREDAKTCWMQARTFPKDADKEKQAETMAGLHAVVVTVLLDEVGSYPQGVIDASEAIFNVKDDDALLVVAGNATDVDGALHTICTKDADKWWIVEITGDPDDPDRSPRIDIEEARREIKKHGRNDPKVMVNILGKFPPKGGAKLLGSNEVEAAMKRGCPEHLFRKQPRVWGLDVAGEGLKPDEATLYKRQGPVAFLPRTWRNIETLKLAEQVHFEYVQAKKQGKAPKRIFVDKGGIGRGCWEYMVRLIGDDVVIGIDFGETALEEDEYVNRRTEMWCRGAMWVRDNGCLPDVPELRRDLTAPNLGTKTTNEKGTRRALESKDEMKKRGCVSPDHGDGFSLTFAMDVLPDEIEEQQSVAALIAQKQFNPYDHLGGRR